MIIDLDKYPNLMGALENNKIVYIFGTGISSSLTGVPYGWYQWILDGINTLHDTAYGEKLRKQLEGDNSADNMISVVSKLMAFAKSEGSYDDWMKEAFETNSITNFDLASTLGKILMTQDVLATTNYDLLLEKSTNLETVSYEEPDIIFPMLEKNSSTHVIHLHGVYDSENNIDNIIADEIQYSDIYNNEGAQFIQNILGTRTLIFVGCGQTTEDINIARFIKFANEHLKLNIPYYFLHKSNTVLPEMPDTIIPIEYGSNYNDLPLFLEEMVQHRTRHFLMKNPIIGRTVYEKEDIISSGIQSYHFAQESIDFKGREEELRDLEIFLRDNRLCCWWAITGQAGSGKSRLAYEFMNRNKTKWFPFFLNDLVTIAEVKDFRPFSDTIIAIDYVNGREKEISEVIQQLLYSFKKSPYKLRLLLMEREYSTVTGSWYDLLTKSLGNYNRERFEKIEYKRSKVLANSPKRLEDCHDFIYLEDLDIDAVVSIIENVCSKQGLPKDHSRDIKLKDEYGRKFEQLKYRPLFVQIFVEAWIENDCNHPRYDGFEELLEIVLKKEQERWLKIVGGDIECVNALIRILVRGSSGNGLDILNLPEPYQKDWDKLQNYIKAHSFPGEQRKHSLEIFISDICQSINNDNTIIMPLYPDIIKEYMFAYYNDKETVLEVCEELWENAGKEFSTFLSRCLTDFRDNELFIYCIENAPDELTNIYAMVARMALLNRRIIQPKDDISNIIARIDKEYDYWNSIDVGDNTDISIAIAKCGGLSKLAEQYGAWMKIDKMMDCIDKILLLPSDEALDMLKAYFLSERINQLSQYGYLKELNELQLKLDNLYKSNNENQLIALAKIQGINANMMTNLFKGDFFKAFELLKSIEKQFNEEDHEQVKMYAHSCFNMIQYSFLEDMPHYIQNALEKLELLYGRHYENIAVKSFYLQGKIQELQYRFFRESKSSVDKGKIKKEIDEIINEVNSNEMCIELTEAWAMAHMFLMNFIDKDKPELIQEILIKSETLLNQFPGADTVAQTYIRAIHAINKDFYNVKVKKNEVEKAFAYVQRFPESESIQEVFFEMLVDSEEKDDIQHYMTKPIVSERMNQLFRELAWEGGTYRRETPKVGRNDPCPCGSGKKYKRCCG